MIIASRTISRTIKLSIKCVCVEMTKCKCIGQVYLGSYVLPVTWCCLINWLINYHYDRGRFDLVSVWNGVGGVCLLARGHNHARLVCRLRKISFEQQVCCLDRQ